MKNLRLTNNVDGIIREFDDFNQLKQYIILIEDEKAITFVEHIKNHLRKYKEQGISLDYDGKVVCKICLKTIDEIYEEERDD